MIEFVARDYIAADSMLIYWMEQYRGISEQNPAARLTHHDRMEALKRLKSELTPQYEKPAFEHCLSQLNRIEQQELRPHTGLKRTVSLRLQPSANRRGVVYPKR